MSTYRAALVGCGRIGSLWEHDPPVPLTHAGAMSLIPDVQIVAGASGGKEHLEAFGRRWGVKSLYLDYREMLAKERIDFLCIATHPGLHLDIIESAVSNGVRAVFCEKPFALCLKDADRMVEICAQNNVILAVNHSRRWYASYRKAKELLDQGVIGDLVSMYGTCMGAKPYPAWQAEEEGPMLHDAVHRFDLLRFFAGNVVSCIGTALRRSLPYRVEDDTQVIFEFDSGVSAVAQVNELTRYSHGVQELYGTTGVISLHDKGHRLYASHRLLGHRKEPDPLIDWWGLEEQPFPQHTPNQPLLDAVQETVDCLQTGGRPSSTGEDGVASLEMCMAVYESHLRDNQRVSLPLTTRDSQLYALRDAGKL